MIRQATLEDLPHILHLGEQFAKASKFIRYDPQIALATWTTLLNSGMATIFILKDYQGMLGAMAYPDPNSGELTATEFFWWVDPVARGQGLQLLEAYEAWAEEKGCTRAIMVHLADSMPQRLQSLYRRRGYEEMETHFVKEL